jgi:Flp pilus assembly protein TadD
MGYSSLLWMAGMVLLPFGVENLQSAQQQTAVTQGISMDNNDPAVLESQANQLLNQGDYPGAEALYRKALAVREKSSPPWGPKVPGRNPQQPRSDAQARRQVR